MNSARPTIRFLLLVRSYRSLSYHSESETKMKTREVLIRVFGPTGEVCTSFPMELEECFTQVNIARYFLCKNLFVGYVCLVIEQIF